MATGFILFKKNDDVTYPMLGNKEIRVPQHELYTRKGKILVFRKREHCLTTKDGSTLKVEFDPTKCCWEDG